MKVHYKWNEISKDLIDVISVDLCKDIEGSLGKGYLKGNGNHIFLRDKIINYCPFCGKGILFIEHKQ